VNFNDLVKGDVQLSGRGSGEFQKIRDIANKMVPSKKGECIELSKIAKTVEKQAKLGSSQEAYNYTTNALKADNRFIRLKMLNKRVVIMRTDGDKDFAEKAVKELREAGRLAPVEAKEVTAEESEKE
jgi:hypothetical protein